MSSTSSPMHPNAVASWEALALWDAAVLHAAHGLPVLPVRPGSKSPLTRHGLLDASPDLGVIDAWWTRHPDANVAVAIPPGRAVVDVDPRNGGDATLAALESRYGPLPHTVTALTGGGGRHFWLLLPDGMTAKSCGDALGPGVDVKAQGGYVVVPSSLHASGRPYTYAAGCELGVVPIATAPAWVVELLRKSASPEGRTLATPRHLKGVGRNVELTRRAGSYRARGVEIDELTTRLVADNRALCAPPLDLDEVRRLANSVGHYPAGEEPFATARDARVAITRRCDAALRDGSLPPHVWRVLDAVYALAHHRGSTQFQASVCRIAAEAGVAKSTAQAHLRALEALGELTSSREPGVETPTTWRISSKRDTDGTLYLKNKPPSAPGLVRVKTPPRAKIDTARLSPTARRIGRLLAVDGSVSIADLEASGMHRRTAQRGIAELLSAGVVLRRCRRRWHLVHSLPTARVPLARGVPMNPTRRAPQGAPVNRRESLVLVAKYGGRLRWAPNPAGRQSGHDDWSAGEVAQWCEADLRDLASLSGTEAPRTPLEALGRVERQAWAHAHGPCLRTGVHWDTADVPTAEDLVAATRLRLRRSGRTRAAMTAPASAPGGPVARRAGERL